MVACHGYSEGSHELLMESVCYQSVTRRLAIMRSYFLRDAGYLRLLFDYFEVKGGYVDVFGGNQEITRTRRLINWIVCRFLKGKCGECKCVYSVGMDSGATKRWRVETRVLESKRSERGGRKSEEAENIVLFHVFGYGLFWKYCRRR